MRKYSYITLILLLVFGCSEKFSDDNFLSQKPHTYNWLMENAWQAFSESEFDLAILYFQTAASRDATKSEPYLGLGWSFARSASLDLLSAESNFNAAIIFSEFDPMGAVFENEARAGLAVIYWASGDNSQFENAISQIDIVLENNLNFIFRYDANISSESLSAIKYQLQYNLGDITTLYSQMVENGFSFSTVESTIGGASVSHTETTMLDGKHLGTLEELYVDGNEDCMYNPAETFTDIGIDGCLDSFEDGSGGCLSVEDPGFVPGSDPNGDNFDGSTGTEGNSIWDSGETLDDANGNFIWDGAESFTDANDDEVWNSDNTAYKLISVSSVESCDLGLIYEISNIDEGLNTLSFQGNPVLDEGDTIILNYNYTTDYGSFINELLGLLANQ
jgi:hypothetical protein